MDKSQVSVEFLILLSVVIIISFITLNISTKKDAQIDSMRIRLYAKAETDKVANAINSVYILGDSAEKDITMPFSLKDGTKYLISIYPQARVVLINYSIQGKDTLYTSTLLTSNVIGNLTNINTKVRIRNNKGVVQIEK